MHLQGKNDCIVADAGFLSYAFMHKMEQQNRLYIIGAGKNWNFIKEFMRGEESEKVVDITVPNSHPQKDLRGKTMRIRIISMKGSDGTRKHFITNIMKETFILKRDT